jgi:hypothetical protein
MRWPASQADACALWLREIDAAVIRIDAVWLAVDPVDMRAGADRLLASVVQAFGAAGAHHGYLFANARSSRIKLLMHDGFGVWCAVCEEAHRHRRHTSAAHCTTKAQARRTVIANLNRAAPGLARVVGTMQRPPPPRTGNHRRACV